MSGDKKRKLPEGWRWGKIKDVIENNIQVFTPENYDEEKFIYIDISSVDNVRKKILNTNQVLVKDAPSRAKSILKENDIIISTVRPNLNTVALVDKSHAGNICSSGFCVIRLKNSYHAPYFFYYLTSPYFVEAVSNMVQGAMYPAISNDDIKFFSIPLPSLLSDQLVIASDLEHRMAHVEKMRAAALHQKDAIAAMQGAILREVFSYEEGDELPEGWKWNIIKDVIENNIQIFNPENYDNEKFIYIDISSVDNVSKKIFNTGQMLVKEAPSRAKSILKENDIIISTVRPNLNTVALVDKSRAGNICSSGFCVIRLKNDYHAPYFFYYLTSPYFVEAVSNMVQGAMYPAISNDDVKDFSIPLPPLLSDQLSIAAELERKMAELEKARQAAQRQVEAIEALPGAILREVFDFEEENTGS